MISVKEAFPEYEKPSVAIDVVVTRVVDFPVESNRQVAKKGLQVLLISEKDKKGDNSDKKWHLPGTILHLGETPKDAIDRIIINKTNISNAYIEQLYTVADNPLRDDRGHIISIVYTAIVSSNDNIGVVDNSRYDCKWAWVEKADRNGNRNITLENGEKLDDLKYDHKYIISDTIDRLKNKLMYTDIGFRFIGEMFTIKELENVFEAINERNIPGFRRIIGNKVVGTGKMSDGKAFRPAELYIKRGGYSG